MNRLAVERYKSQVRRQSAAIWLADAQTRIFHTCFGELEADGIKVAETAIAKWLNERHVVCSRRYASKTPDSTGRRPPARWSPKTVGDRLFIDQRLQIEAVCETGLAIADRLTDEEDIYLFASWHAIHSPNICEPMLKPYEVKNCVRQFAVDQREWVDFVAQNVRAGRTFVD
ncbi:hypothetical protein [Sphingomonas sp. PB1R3]|uniref:hypothetical protein n=1 Tax=Sphingomonas flavida TaxID=3096154 RepID=UPI002FC6D5D5